MINYILLIAGIAGLATTITLAAKGKMTLSQRAQTLAPRGVDWVIGLGGWTGLLWMHDAWGPIDPILLVFWAGFWGHIWIANKERYGE